MSLDVRIDVKENIPEMDKQNAKAIKNATKESLDVAFDKVVRDTPKKTGTLRGGYQKIIRPNVALIKNAISYLKDVENDTPPHKIEGNPLLAFEWNGRMMILHSVQHPGTKGKKMIQKTNRFMKTKSKEIFRKHLAKVGKTNG